MKNKNFSYLLKEGIRGVFLHGFMSFAAVCVTIACLVIMGSFSLIMVNLNHMVLELEQENQILVYIDETYTEAEAKSVGSQINLLPNVELSEFVSREQALDHFVSEQDDTTIFEGIEADTFRDRFVVTVDDPTLMKETASALEQIQGVAKVNAHLDIAEGFLTIQKVLRIVSTAIIAVLLVVSLFIISNTVKLAMYDRKEEIAIMKMVGATNGFIRLPFVVEGFILGALGAIIAFFAEWGLYNLLASKISSIDTLQLFTMLPFSAVLGTMVAAFSAAGLFVGVFGSVMSIRKFLNV